MPFLIVVGLVLPMLVWANARHAKAHPVADEDLPSIGAMALQAIVLQATIFGLAWMAMSGMDVRLAWSSRLDPVSTLAAAGIVALGMAVVWADSRRRPDPSNVIGRVLARSSPAHPGWLALVIAAGITEEFAFRGVLTGLLTLWLGPAAAWLVSAGLFGVSHSLQGWRGLLGSAAFALALQGVVWLSGGLMLAILAHMAYDLGAVWLGSLLTRRQESERAIEPDQLGTGASPDEQGR